MIRNLLLGLTLVVAACQSTGGVTLQATGRMTGDVRTRDGAWVAIGEAELVVRATASETGPIVFIPLHVDKGRVWARNSDGVTVEQSISDPFPEWVLALYAPGELEDLLRKLLPTPPLP